jgi:hypothetical protein
VGAPVCDVSVAVPTMAQIENFPVLLHALTSADATQRVPAEELFQNAKAATPQELIGALLAAIGQVS